MQSTATNNFFGVVIFIFVFFMFVIAPTSSNGQMPAVGEIIINWVVISMAVLLSMNYLAKTNITHFFLVLLVLTYMLIITIISNNNDGSAEFSLARLAPFLCFLLLSTVTFNKNIPINLIKLTIHSFMIIFFIWNLLIILGNSTIFQFTINNYSQLYEGATSNMFLKRRPIMSFGIYTFASFFYFLFFLIIRKLFQLTKKRIYFVYLILILIANILLVSNTSFVFSIIMLAYIYFSINNKRFRLLLLVFAGAAFLVLINSPTIVDYYLESFNSDSNGVKGRYTNTGTLSTNIDYLKEHFFIGFNIVRGANLTYTDSGYILYYTMGGPIFLFFMFYSLYRFAKNNLSKVYLLFLIPILLFETALPIIIYYKFIYSSIFFLLCYKSLSFNSNSVIKK